MEFALIHNNQLILGPIGFNVRMINSELEDLELDDRISPQSYLSLPIHFSDGLTHLVEIERVVPEHDPKYQNVGNFTWEIVEENNTPVRVRTTFEISDKTLEEVKGIRRQEIVPTRKSKENTTISLTVNETTVDVSTSREERLLLASKFTATPGPHNYKFGNTWIEITAENLQYIITEIDKVVQQAYDWELAKHQEIDACTTIDEVYDVVIVEQPERPENIQPSVE